MAFSGTYDIATITNPSSALTDFTLIVDLSRMSAAWWTACTSSDGTKGRAAKSDGVTELACDWIDFDDVAESGLLRVKYSGTLASSGTQQIRVYPPISGNSSYGVSDTYGQYNSYDSNWRLYLPSGGGNDRTINQQNTTAFGSPSIGGIAGKVGVATDYGSTQYSDTDSALNLGTNQGSIIAWTLNGASGSYLCGRGFNDLIFVLFTATRLRFRLANGDTDVENNTLDDTVWSHVAGVSNATDSTLYVDGSTTGTASATNTPSSGTLTIGDRASGFSSSEVKLNEFQVHDVARESEWINQEYDQANDNATFWGTWTNVPSGATYTLTAATGTFSITGQNAGLTINRNVAAASGSLAITGQAATLTTDRVLVSDAGTMAITGQDASLIYGQAFTLTAETGSFSIVGQDAVLNRDYVIDSQTGVLTITGNAVTLTYSGESKEYYKVIETKADLTTILNSNGDVITTLSTKGEIA